MRPRFRLAALSMVVAAVATAPVIHAQGAPSAPAEVETSTARLLRAHTPQIQAWIAGACTGEVVPAVCYPAMTSAMPAATVDEPGFDWVDAGLGATATLGMALLAGGAGLAVARQRRRRHVASP